MLYTYHHFTLLALVAIVRLIEVHERLCLLNSDRIILLKLHNLN